MKNIRELTEDEAKELLNFVYPNNKYISFLCISFEPKMTDKGQQVTFNMMPIIGIEYHNGQDRCILHFEDTKVVLWLYKNGYDITELLETNSYFSEMESNFDTLAMSLSFLVKGKNGLKKEVEHLFTLEYVQSKCKELLDKYFYIDYQ
jgi:hypothetical protein